MKLNVLRESSLEKLRSNISGNAGMYVKDEPWIQDYFASGNWQFESPIELPDDFELLIPDKDSSYDLENSKRVYLALKGLTPTQAADERIWSYLSHVVCWNYMRVRWNAEKYTGGAAKLPQYIRERYFFMPNRDRALVRNGIARLWTYAHVTYDPHRDDPFELTETLLQKLDIAQQLLERSFSRASKVTRAVLDVVRSDHSEVVDLTVRENFRDLMRHINRVGGVTILDVLDEPDLSAIVKDRVEVLAQHAKAA